MMFIRGKDQDESYPLPIHKETNQGILQRLNKIIQNSFNNQDNIPDKHKPILFFDLSEVINYLLLNQLENLSENDQKKVGIELASFVQILSLLRIKKGGETELKKEARKYFEENSKSYLLKDKSIEKYLPIFNFVIKHPTLLIHQFALFTKYCVKNGEESCLRVTHDFSAACLRQLGRLLNCITPNFLNENVARFTKYSAENICTIFYYPALIFGRVKSFILVFEQVLKIDFRGDISQILIYSNLLRTLVKEFELLEAHALGNESILSNQIYLNRLIYFRQQFILISENNMDDSTEVDLSYFIEDERLKKEHKDKKIKFLDLETCFRFLDDCYDLYLHLRFSFSAYARVLGKIIDVYDERKIKDNAIREVIFKSFEACQSLDEFYGLIQNIEIKSCYYFMTMSQIMLTWLTSVQEYFFVALNDKERNEERKKFIEFISNLSLLKSTYSNKEECIEYLKSLQKRNLEVFFKSVKETFLLFINLLNDSDKLDQKFSCYALPNVTAENFEINNYITSINQIALSLHTLSLFLLDFFQGIMSYEPYIQQKPHKIFMSLELIKTISSQLNSLIPHLRREISLDNFSETRSFYEDVIKTFKNFEFMIDGWDCKLFSSRDNILIYFKMILQVFANLEKAKPGRGYDLKNFIPDKYREIKSTETEQRNFGELIVILRYLKGLSTAYRIIAEMNSHLRVLEQLFGIIDKQYENNNQQKMLEFDSFKETNTKINCIWEHLIVLNSEKDAKKELLIQIISSLQDFIAAYQLTQKQLDFVSFTLFLESAHRLIKFWIELQNVHTTLPFNDDFISTEGLPEQYVKFEDKLLERIALVPQWGRNLYTSIAAEQSIKQIAGMKSTNQKLRGKKKKSKLTNNELLPYFLLLMKEFATSKPLKENRSKSEIETQISKIYVETVNFAATCLEKVEHKEYFEVELFEKFFYPSLETIEIPIFDKAVEKWCSFDAILHSQPNFAEKSKEISLDITLLRDLIHLSSSAISTLLLPALIRKCARTMNQYYDHLLRLAYEAKTKKSAVNKDINDLIKITFEKLDSEVMENIQAVINVNKENPFYIHIENADIERSEINTQHALPKYNVLRPNFINLVIILMDMSVNKIFPVIEVLIKK